jgi:hypothetical protein
MWICVLSLFSLQLTMMCFNYFIIKKILNKMCITNHYYIKIKYGLNIDIFFFPKIPRINTKWIHADFLHNICKKIIDLFNSTSNTSMYISLLIVINWWNLWINFIKFIIFLVINSPTWIFFKRLKFPLGMTQKFITSIIG